MRADLLASGQWRIPASEIARLQREKIPPIPQGLRREEERTLAEDDWEPEAPNQIDSGRSAETNAKVAESAHQISIARNQLEKRKIDLQRAELEDRFRTREKQAAGERAARALAARQQWEQKWEAERQQRWRDDWQSYALQSLPWDAPPEVRMNLPDFVDEALARTDRQQPQHVTQSLVDATIAHVLKPHRRLQAIDRVIKDEVDRLVDGANGALQPTEYRLRATAAAQQSARQFPEDASLEEIQFAVHQAVEPVIREFAHKSMCERIVSQLAIPGATPDELKQAQAALRPALDSLHVGCSAQQIQAVMLEVLSPLCQHIDLRQYQALRQDVIRCCSFPWGFSNAEKEQALRAVQAAIADLPQGAPRHQLEQVRDQAIAPFLAALEIRQKKADLVEKGVSAISFCLTLLRIEGKPIVDVSAFTIIIRERIRALLERQLTGNETPVQVRELVDGLVRQTLGLQPKTP